MKRLPILIGLIVMLLAMSSVILLAQQTEGEKPAMQGEMKADSTKMPEQGTQMKMQETQKEMPSKMPAATIKVEEIACGTDVVDRELQGKAETFTPDVGKVYCWALITGDNVPATVDFVWTHNGEEMARVPLNIKYERMRTWSSKNIMPDWTGDWKVEVVDPDGNVLASTSFTVQ
jgi:hypothetical protein